MFRSGWAKSAIGQAETLVGGHMTKQINIQEFELDLDQLHRRAVDLTRELGNVNYALREKRRELEMLGTTLDARVYEQTRELKEANERLRESEWLKSIFWPID
jgi:predicted  nucleic acid-binding Zn-ribbon protein